MHFAAVTVSTKVRVSIEVSTYDASINDGALNHSDPM